MRIKFLAALLLLPALAFAQVTIYAPGERIRIGGSDIRLSAPAFDSDAISYFIRSGVTDATAKRQISDFVRGVKALGLWSGMVCWPLRSAQNAGSGTTAYSLGGVGPYNGTLVNGPTWGASGVSFDGVDDRITVATFPKGTEVSSVFGVFYNQAGNANCEYLNFASIPSLAFSRGSSGAAYNISQTSPGAFPNVSVSTAGDNQAMRHIGFAATNAASRFIRLSPAASGTSATALAQVSATPTLSIGWGAVLVPLRLSTVTVFNTGLSIAQMQSVATLISTTLDTGL
jgi:hypothetical protein